MDVPLILQCLVMRLYLSFSVTDKGQLCVFPFKYKGKTYEECITEGKDRPWCATTENYQGDEKWGFCSSSKYFLYFMYKGLGRDLAALKSIHACNPLVNAFSFFPTFHLIATARKESTIIFTCDENAGIGSPYLLSETLGCAVTFEWKTQAVCPPKNMECKFIQKHRTYDLRMLSSLTGSWIFFHNGNS